MQNKPTLIVLCALAALHAPARAADGLAQALEAAWQRHPAAQAQAAQTAESEAAHALAAALTPEPAALSVGSLSDRYNRNRGRQEYEAEISAPLWLPGQQAARQGEAQAQAAALTARRQAQRLELAGELREAWWSLAAARQAVQLAQHRLDTARALATDVGRRFQAGEVSRIDANLARSEEHTAENEWLEAQAAQHKAEQAYRLLTGTLPPAQLAQETPASAVVGTATADAAAASHPRLALAQASTHAARARLLASRADNRAAPELAVRLVRERGDFNEIYANSIGVRVKIPFSSAPRTARASAAAQAEIDQAQAEAQRTGEALVLDIETARQALAAAARQGAIARERHALAADSLRLAQKAFSLGETDLASLLRLRAAAFDAESWLGRQEIAHAAAVSRLNQALGVLP